MIRRIPGTVLAERQKGVAAWQARISHDRGRLEVIAIVPPSSEPTIIEPLTEPELLELLGESEKSGVPASKITQAGGRSRRMFANSTCHLGALGISAVRNRDARQG